MPGFEWSCGQRDHADREGHADRGTGHLFLSGCLKANGRFSGELYRLRDGFGAPGVSLNR